MPGLHLDLNLDATLTERFKKMVDPYYHGNPEQAILDLIQKELNRLQTKERLQAVIGLLKEVSEQDMKKFEDSVNRHSMFGGRSIAL